jgi:hypothetical protein
MTDKKKGRPIEGSPKDQFDRDHRPPIVTGQAAEVLELLRSEGAVLSFLMTADLAIPEAAARVHDLRGMGFNVLTTILPEVEFRGRIRRNAALYLLGSPSWPAPGFLDDTKQQAGFMLPDASLLAGLLILAVAALLLAWGV